MKAETVLPVSPHVNDSWDESTRASRRTVRRPSLLTAADAGYGDPVPGVDRVRHARRLEQRGDYQSVVARVG